MICAPNSNIPRPQIPSVTQLLPAESLLLMGADPGPVPADVARAGGMVINHLGETTDMVVRHIQSIIWLCLSDSRPAYLWHRRTGFGSDGDGDGQSALARAGCIGLKMWLFAVVLPRWRPALGPMSIYYPLMMDWT